LHSVIFPHGGIKLNKDDHDKLLAYALEEKKLLQYVIQGHDIIYSIACITDPYDYSTYFSSYHYHYQQQKLFSLSAAADAYQA
jgi:hypothetical protein